jgi:hypothetical protein
MVRAHFAVMQQCPRSCFLVLAMSARTSKAVHINIAQQDLGIDPLTPQLIINRCLPHGATPYTSVSRHCRHLGKLANSSRAAVRTRPGISDQALPDCHSVCHSRRRRPEYRRANVRPVLVPATTPASPTAGATPVRWRWSGPNRCRWCCRNAPNTTTVRRRQDRSIQGASERIRTLAAGFGRNPN